VAARKCGIHRTTLWRWKQKWQTLNVNVSQEKLNRPTRSTSFVPAYYRWNIATDSARPHTSPSAVSPAIVARVLALREQLNRCAEVIWCHLTRIGDAQGVVSVSLSSVRRILRRHHRFDGARKKRVRPDNPRRLRCCRGVEVYTLNKLLPTHQLVVTMFTQYDRRPTWIWLTY
jgi:transposase-like protein